MRGRCAAIAQVTLQATANVKARSTIVRSIVISGLFGSSEVVAWFGVPGRKMRFNGRPIKMCAAAQAKQVSRHPMLSRPDALNGQPIVLAKPASRVIEIQSH